jgi:hypothetical protein
MRKELEYIKPKKLRRPKKHRQNKLLLKRHLLSHRKLQLKLLRNHNPLLPLHHLIIQHRHQQGVGGDQEEEVDFGNKL